MQPDIQTAITDVLNLQEFAPSERVNTVMSQLVDSVIDNDFNTIALFGQSTTSQIRTICANTETEMEKFWARLVVAAPNSLLSLQSFPYIENYQELTKRELALVESSGFSLTEAHSALVIGSGPLPLSAYELHRQSGVIVDHVDSSSEAIQLSRRVNEALGVQSGYYEAYGQDVVLNKKYDLILVAALAGATAIDKQQIIDNILPHLSDNGRVIVRSARGSRELLYPAISSGDLVNVRLLEEYHPTDYIINSVFVYGK